MTTLDPHRPENGRAKILWLQSVFEMADAAADASTTFDAGTMWWAIVTREIPTVAIVCPERMRPTGDPSKIPAFYSWVSGYVLEGKL